MNWMEDSKKQAFKRELDNVLDQMKALGMLQMQKTNNFYGIENSKEVLAYTMQNFLGETKLQWLDEYDEVADWLSDNQGRGLFLHGSCGRGKSILTKFVIPAIMLGAHRKVVKVYDSHIINSRLEESLTRSFIALDDVGTENVFNQYGNKRLAFAEIMDYVEKQNKLVFISTNLNGQQIQERYGKRVVDRIIATTRRIEFTGKSLRR